MAEVQPLSSLYALLRGAWPDVNVVAGEDVNEDDALVDTLDGDHLENFGRRSDPKPPVSLSCRCNADEVPADTIAYVQSGAPYVIHACPVFWSLSMLPANHIGEPSKVGTMVHEFTHFTDDKGMALRHPPVPGKNVSSLSYALELAASSSRRCSIPERVQVFRFGSSTRFFSAGIVRGRRVRSLEPAKPPPVTKLRRATPVGRR